MEHPLNSYEIGLGLISLLGLLVFVFAAAGILEPVTRVIGVELRLMNFGIAVFIVGILIPLSSLATSDLR